VQGTAFTYGIFLAINIHEKLFIIGACLSAHNRLRALHINTQPLEWDDSLAVQAQQYAEELLRRNQGLVHASGNFGENLYQIHSQTEGTCADASLHWYIYYNIGYFFWVVCKRWWLVYIV